MKKKIPLRNIIKHFKLITKHKWHVFKLCVKAGIPIRGFLHDFSKYSYVEFFESARFYEGNHSPIIEARKKQGYSLSFVHHTNKNKHHPEYWFDIYAKDKAPVMPYKYAVEMVCDKVAAGICYAGKNFVNSEPLEYFLKCGDEKYLNSKTYEFVIAILTDVKNKGIDKSINAKNLKSKYRDICEK